MTEWRFAAQHNLIFSCVLIGILVVILFGCINKCRVWSLLAGQRRWNDVFQNYRPWRFWTKPFCAALGSIFLFLVLLQPQWGKKKEEVVQEGRELYILLDISRSMLVTDLEPSRFAVAKKKVEEIVDVLKSERLGLVLFSSSAWVQCPLTTDTLAFKSFLNCADPCAGGGGGTALDKALEVAMKGFDAVGSGKSRIIVLYTDGEDFSPDLASIKKELVERGIKLFAVGVGTDSGAPIPILTKEGAILGYEKNEEGNVAISRLNRSLLMSLANDLGGEYVAITKDSSDVHRIAERVASFEKERFGERAIEQLQDRYYIFALTSFFFFLIEWVL